MIDKPTPPDLANFPRHRRPPLLNPHSLCLCDSCGQPAAVTYVGYGMVFCRPCISLHRIASPLPYRHSPDPQPQPADLELPA
jgi:hypothetical protein